MRFSLNGRASKLDVNDVQLMNVFKPEIKMSGLEALTGRRYEKRKSQLLLKIAIIFQ